jgi:hypothetical protein
MNPDLWTYMTSHEVDLAKSGSAERGFSQKDVLGLLDLLREQNIQPLGLEVWRRREDIYKIDSLAGWITTPPAGINASFAEIVEVVTSAKSTGQTAFTLQF